MTIGVVTGAAGGIGAAVVRALAGAGLTVVGVDRDDAGLATLVEETEYPSRLHVDVVDVTDAGAVDVFVAKVEADIGPIGVLVNVAGVLHRRPALELTPEDWQDTFAVNTTAVMNVSRAVGRRMKARRSGSIVTVGSNAGTVPRVGVAAYCASKAASRIYTQVLGLELAEFGVRANVVSPGSTDTAMLRTWAGPDADVASTLIAGQPEEFKTAIPLRRLADPDDIADAVAFLASDKARHITMHDLRVDGGATLGC